jgi:hypothetical protein
MSKGNKRKDELLGEPHGTANGKLRKSIIFWLVQETGKDICHRCGEKIETIEELSIEHKDNWMSAENPIESFYDLGNIAFSHLGCNVGAADRSNTDYAYGEKVGNAKLSNIEVINIKNDLKNNMSNQDIYKKYDIGKYVLYGIKVGRIWNKVN